jgi:hypothetical protein
MHATVARRSQLIDRLTRSVEIKIRHLKSFNLAIALKRSLCPWFPKKKRAEYLSACYELTQSEHRKTKDMP